MESSELCYLSAGQLSRLIRRKKLSPVEIVEACLSRIESVEPALNSFITLLPDQALAAARKAEKEILAGRLRGPLHGIPIGLKDLFHLKGVRTTSGSMIYDRFVPDSDSTLAARLKEAGAIFLGKLNLHPFAYGVTGENDEYGPMHNPWNTALITGGSSGGSGSAVASGQCPLALGTDTGGSIRIPGSFCGLAGLKPTYGRLSRHGITPLAWSQDHPGPMARTVEDCALVMNAAAGYDPRDPTSANLPVPDYTRFLKEHLTGFRVGIVKEVFEAPVAPQVKDSVLKAIRKLGELGASIREISWPLYPYGIAIANTIQMVEAAAYHSRMIREKGDRIYAPVRLRLESGIFVSGTDYVQAQRARTLFYQKSIDLMKEVDLLAGPTLPVPAFEIGNTVVPLGDRRVNVVPLLTQYTRPFNLNGFPAMTVPCGFSDGGLPFGLQLAGRPFEEGKVLQAAHAYEQATEWHLIRPPL